MSLSCNDWLTLSNWRRISVQNETITPISNSVSFFYQPSGFNFCCHCLKGIFSDLLKCTAKGIISFLECFTSISSLRPSWHRVAVNLFGTTFLWPSSFNKFSSMVSHLWVDADKKLYNCSTNIKNCVAIGQDAAAEFSTRLSECPAHGTNLAYLLC